MSLINDILAKLGLGTAHAGTEAAPPPSEQVPADAGRDVNQTIDTSAPNAGPKLELAAKLDKDAEHHAQTHHETLNWRTSVVDLLKLLGRDSSLTYRRQLASELGYPGDLNGSTEALNNWLRTALWQQVVAHGGTLPADL